MTLKTVTYDTSTHKIVPIEPTNEMVNKGLDAHYYERNSLQSIYKAMLDAAPDIEPKDWR